MTVTSIGELRARCGIAGEYLDANYQHVVIPEATQNQVLRCMGFEPSAEQAQAALAALDREVWERILPPVLIAREGAALQFPLRLDTTLTDRPLAWRVSVAGGDDLEQSCELAAMELTGSYQLEGRCIEGRSVVLQLALPRGEHRLELVDNSSGAALAELPLIIAPATCYEPETLRSLGRVFGITVQLYTVRSQRNWGMGDFTDLKNLVTDAATHGIDIVGVNPLHALFAANPLHFSPYSPSNRAFINVMYLDPEAVPEYAACEEAQRRVTDAEFQSLLEALRAAERVDYVSVAKQKFAVLEPLFAHFREHEVPRATPRAQAYRQFVAEQGAPLRLHATYEALHEHFFSQDFNQWGWPVWPEEFRRPESAAVSEFAAQHAQRIEYHQYLQWCAFEQLRAAQQAAVAAGMSVGVYLDLAVGIDQSGSEAWANQSLYCFAASTGAPPDRLGPGGQDWGFPPLDPKALKEDAYALFTRNLRSSMSCAGSVRFDHAVALMRLWWVPRGHGAREGAYVHYDLQDIMAVLALESWRNQCLIIGEDLGTVPEYLTRVMTENHLYSYRVLFLDEKVEGQFTPPDLYPAKAVATLTTHDLATLASWWDQSDVNLRVELQMWTEPEMIESMRMGREQDKQLLLDTLYHSGFLAEPLQAADVPVLTNELNGAVHAFLASSRAGVMLAQLEDLLGMAEPVNIPGTFHEYPNWQRKLDCSLEHLFERPSIVSICAKLQRLRV